MARSGLVTSRMGRNVTTWREKIDPQCVEYLEAYRAATKLYSAPERDIGDMTEWLRQWQDSLEPFPNPPMPDQPPSVIILERQFISVLQRLNISQDVLHEGENTLPFPGYAKILEVAQSVALILENPQIRAYLYFVIGLAYIFFESLIRNLRVQQFGTQPLDLTKVRSLIAMILDFLANLVRGRWEPLKGRHDLELVFIVSLIEQHKKQQLTARELRDAITHAGIAVPDLESWRMWIHRARKSGLIPKNKARHRNQQNLKSDHVAHLR